MIDLAHSATDEELKKIESRIKAIYTQAQKEITESWDAYMAESKSQLSELQQDYEDAKKAGDKKQMKITGIKLAQAKKEITIQNRRFQDMVNDVAYRISNTNQIAVDYINGKMPSIYTVNYNAVNGDAVKVGIDFSLVDEHTVRKMIIEGDISLPRRKVDIPKDMLWNKKQINSSVLQGIIQGESIEKIAARISPIIQNNANSSIRLARTMTTAAECGGRIDSYHELESLGVVQKKVWMATPDDRTRPSHIDIDGEEQDIDDMFSNGCQYPGDGNGPADEVWNCRCSVRTNIIGFMRSDGSVSKIDYERKSTLHDRQMEEEKERRRKNE
jgi:hypothetical protein